MPGHFNQSTGLENYKQAAIVLLDNLLLRVELKLARGCRSSRAEAPDDAGNLCIRVKRPEGLGRIGFEAEILVFLEPVIRDLDVRDPV